MFKRVRKVLSDLVLRHYLSDVDPVDSFSGGVGQEEFVPNDPLPAQQSQEPPLLVDDGEVYPLPLHLECSISQYVCVGMPVEMVVPVSMTVVEGQKDLGIPRIDLGILVKVHVVGVENVYCPRTGQQARLLSGMVNGIERLA